MNYALPYKTKQFFFVLIKLSIVAGAFYFIYNKLTQNDSFNFNDFIQFLSIKKVFSFKNIFFLLFLSILNWFLEILKWKVLVSSIKNISFKESLEQSLGALTASLFTPNRIGEYGVKAIYFTSGFRKRTMLLNLIGNMMQMSITVILGIIGLFYFLKVYSVEIDYYKLARLLLLVLIIVSIVGIGVSKVKFSIKGYSIKKVKDYILKIKLSIKIKAFLLSLCRYLVFSFQFYFITTLFNVELGYLNAMIIITSMYLLSSVIPSLFIFDVIIKGSVAVFLFSYAGVNNIIVLSTVTIMWLLNFALPSVFGSFYVLNFNFPKEDQ